MDKGMEILAVFDTPFLFQETLFFASADLPCQARLQFIGIEIGIGIEIRV
jgi:hypothetical protein